MLISVLFLVLRCGSRGPGGSLAVVTCFGQVVILCLFGLLGSFGVLVRAILD